MCCRSVGLIECGVCVSGEKMDDDEITELIQTVDIDGDGEVDLKEFMAVVLDRAFV
jgi:Ca2+-binding EF-hand superfamily protein